MKRALTDCRERIKELKAKKHKGLMREIELKRLEEKRAMLMQKLAI
jgi:hypothetical protein